jgi:type I restriction enzyme, S subunit
MTTLTIPAGYKLTEVGVIPEDWEVKTVDQVSFVTSGKRLPLGSSLVNQPTPHPYIRVTDMKKGTIDLSEIKFVPENVFPAIKRYRIYQTDIFISVAGSLGIVGKIPIELDGANLTENADRITNITCSQDYLLYILMSPLIQNVINSIQTVGAQPKLALTRIRKFTIPFPPTKAEQIAIAAVLSDIDALITKLDELIAKKRLIKKGAMQELLTGQKRLPGFSGAWEVKQLGELANFYKGKGLSKSVINSSGLKPCIHYGELFTRYPETIYKTISRTDESVGCFRSVINDVLMPTSDVTPRGLAKASCIAINNVILGGDILVIRTDSNKVNGSFLSYVIRYDDSQVLRLVAGTTVFHLYGSDMNKFTFLLPSISEQTAIVSVLSDMDGEIIALESRRNKTRALKQGMMQELLTGKTRLV